MFNIWLNIKEILHTFPRTWVSELLKSWAPLFARGNLSGKACVSDLAAEKEGAGEAGLVEARCSSAAF